MGLFSRKKKVAVAKDSTEFQGIRVILTEEAGPDVDAGVIVRGDRYRVITSEIIPAGTYVTIKDTATVDGEKIAHVIADHVATEDVRLRTAARLHNQAGFKEQDLADFVDGKFEERKTEARKAEYKKNEVIDLLDDANARAKDKMNKVLEKGRKNFKVAKSRPVEGAHIRSTKEVDKEAELNAELHVMGVSKEEFEARAKKIAAEEQKKLDKDRAKALKVSQKTDTLAAQKAAEINAKNRKEHEDREKRSAQKKKN